MVVDSTVKHVATDQRRRVVSGRKRVRRLQRPSNATVRLVRRQPVVTQKHVPNNTANLLNNNNYLYYLRYKFKTSNNNNNNNNNNNKLAIEDSNFAPGDVTWRTRRTMTLSSLHYVKTCVTSSTKPEVHNVYYVLHRCQGRTEPRPQITCTKKFREICPVIYASGQTHKQTDEHRQTYSVQTC